MENEIPHAPGIERGRNASENDLKSQLEDIHKRIDQETEQALSRRNSKKNAPFSKILSKRDKRTSMPVFAGSSTHNNVANNNSAKDVNFVVGLSENLLLQCRKLQAENEKKSTNLKSLQHEYEALKLTFEKISRRLHSTEKESTSLKDHNWDLETKLQQVSQQMKEFRESSDKARKDLHKQLVAFEEMRNKFDEAALEGKGLKEELDSVYQKHAREVADLKRNILDLNEENDQLQQKLEDMNSRLISLSRDVSNAKRDTSAQTEHKTDSSLHKLDMLEAADTKVSDLQKHNFESDLETANKVICKLKQQIAALKSQKNASSTRQLVTDTSSPLSWKSTVKGATSRARKEHLTPTKKSGASPSTDLGGQLNDWSFDDSNISISSEPLHAQDSDAGSESDVSDTMDGVRNPLTDELEDNHQVELHDIKAFADTHSLVLLSREEYTTMQDEKKQIFAKDEGEALTILKSKGYNIYEERELQDLKESLLSWHSLTTQESKEKAAKIDKRILSEEEYPALKTPRLEDSLKRVHEAGYETLTKKDLDDINDRVANPSIDIIESTLHKRGEMVIKEEVYDVLKNPDVKDIAAQASAAGYQIVDSKEWSKTVQTVKKPSLGFINAAAKETGHVVCSKKQYQALSNPSIEEISRHASKWDQVLVSKSDHQKWNSFDLEWARQEALARDYLLLSKDEHSILSNPSIASLQQRAVDMGRKLISNEEYKSLSNPSVSDLNRKAEEHHCVVISASELSELRCKLQSPDADFIRSKAKMQELEVLTTAELAKLNSEVANPEIDNVKASIKSRHLDSILQWLEEEMHYVSIREEEFLQLKEIIRSPSVEHLQQKAGDAGYCLVKEEEFKAMNQTIKHPSVDYLRKHCQSHDALVVDKSAYNQLQSQYNSPSIEYLRYNADLNNFELAEKGQVAALEKRLQNPTLEEMEEKIVNMGFLVMKKADLKSLEKKIAEPQLSYLEEKAKSFSLLLVSKQDHQDLITKLEKPDVSYIREKAEPLDVVVVSKKDHQDLVTKLEKPDISYLREKAEPLNLVVVSREDHQDLVAKLEKPDVSYLREKAEALDLSILSVSAYQDMKEKIEKPELSFLKNEAARKDHVLVSSSEYHNMTEGIENPNEKYLKDKAMNLGLQFVSFTEYQDLVQKVRKPDMLYLKEKCESIGFHLVSESEHNEMLETTRKLNEFDVSFFKEKTRAFGWQLTPNNEQEELLKKIENPSITYLKEKAEKMGYRLVSIAEHEKTVTLLEAAERPDASYLKEKAKPLDYLIVSKQEFNDMKKVIEEPEIAYLKEKASGHDMTLITEKEHQQLLRQIDNPDSSYLTEKAKIVGLKVLTNHEFEKITATITKLETPDLKFLEGKLGPLGFLVVSQEEYKRLRDSIENPPLSYLKQKAKISNSVVVPTDEYQNVLDKLESPDLPYLKSKAKGYDIVPNSDFIKLKQLENAPSIEFLAAKCKEAGYLLVNERDQAELSRKLNEPTMDEMEQMAKQVNCLIIDQKELDELKTSVERPSREDVLRHVTSFNMTAIPNNDYEELVTASKKESILKKVEEYGYDVISHHELLALENNQFDKVGIQKIGQLLKDQGFEVIPLAEITELRKPVLDKLEMSDVTCYCDKNGLVILSQREYEALKNAVSNLTPEEIETILSKHEKIVLTEKHFNELVSKSEDPSIELLEHHARKKDKVLVSRESYTKDQDTLNRPSAEVLNMQAKKLNKIMVDMETLEALQATNDSPTLDFLERHAQVKNHHMLPITKFEQLRGKLDNPSDAYLESKALSSGKILVESSKFSELKQRAESPDEEELKRHAIRLNMKILPQADFEKLHTLSQSPPLDFLSISSEALGYSLVSKDDSQVLKMVKEKLNAEELSMIGSSVPHILIPNMQLTALQEELETLSKELQSKTASLKGKVVVEEQQYDAEKSTLKMISNPTPSFVSQLASVINHVLIPSSKLKEMEDIAKKPSVLFLKTKAEEQGLVIISSNEYQELLASINSPSLDFLKAKAQNFDMTLVDVESYRELERIQESPDLEFIRNKMALFPEHILVATDTYESLQKEVQYPTLESLCSKAESYGSTVVDSSDLKRLKDKLDNPSDEYLEKQASERGKALITTKHLQNLEAMAMNPSLEIVERTAAQSGKVMVNVNDLKDMESKIDSPSIDFLKSKLDLKDYSLLTKEEHFKLLDNSKDYDLEHITDVLKNKDLHIIDVAQKSKLDLMELLVSKIGEESVILLRLINNGILEKAAIKDLSRDQLQEVCETFMLFPCTRNEFDLINQNLSGEEYSKLIEVRHNAVVSGCLQETALRSDYPVISFSERKSPGASEISNKNSEAVENLSSKDTTMLGDSSAKTPFQHNTPETSKVLASKEFFERAIKEESTPQKRERVLESARALGFVTLSSEDYKKLLKGQKDHELTKGDLYKGAKAFELTVLPTHEYETLLTLKNGSDSNLSDALQSSVKDTGDLLTSSVAEQGSQSIQNSKSDFEQNGPDGTFNRLDSNSELDDGTSLCSQIDRVSTNESEYYDARQSIASASMLDISASNLDLNATSFEDTFNETLSSAEEKISRTSTVREDSVSRSLSFTHLADLAKTMGFALVRQGQPSESNSFEEVNAEQDAFQLLSSEDELEQPLRSAQVSAPSPNVGFVENSEWQEPARRGIFISTDEYAEYEALKKLSVNLEHQRSVLHESRTILPDDTQSPPPDAAPSTTSIPNTAIQGQDMSSSPAGVDKSDTDAKIDNNKSVCSSRDDKREEERSERVEREESGSEEQHNESIEIQSTDQVRIQSDAKNSTKERVLSKAELIERAHEYGLVSLEAEHFAQIKEELAAGTKHLTLDDIMIKSAEFGLVPIQRSQFEQIKEELSNPTLTRDQIIANASEAGLVAIDRKDFERLNRLSEVKVTDTEDEDLASFALRSSDATDEEQDRRGFENLARKYGLVCIPESKFVATTTASVIDANNVVVLPTSYYDNLLAKEQETLRMTTNEALQAEAKKRGLFMGPKNSTFSPDFGSSPYKQSRISREGTIRSTTSSDSNGRRSLAEAAANAAFNEHEAMNANSRSHSRSASTIRPAILGMDVEVPHVRHTSFDGGISLATVASFSEPSIIPALTQTVIGEYLHKYYRRLGAFSQVTSRHERYFWVHPYTMTLYWSTNNPVLENPATNKTRAAAILGVESIEDLNPYPAGLYHKSIIVRTESRPIKITCATRQRHNIWLNSLRYLLQRSMDGINLDDTAADPTDTNKIYQMPGETVRLTNQRLSSTRRLTSSGSAKHATSSRSLRR